MKMLYFFILLNVLDAQEPSPAVPCQVWQGQVDPKLKSPGDFPRVDELSSVEKMHAISCLLALEGNRGAAKIGGATSQDVSEIVPPASIEIASLFYIRYIYTGKWKHCDSIALRDRDGKYNTSASVKEAFKSYKKWFAKAQQIGLEKSIELGLDPMDDCNPYVRWSGMYSLEHLRKK